MTLISLSSTLHNESKYRARQILSSYPIEHRYCSFKTFKISLKLSGIGKIDQHEKVAYRRYLSNAIGFASF